MLLAYTVVGSHGSAGSHGITELQAGVLSAFLRLENCK